MEEWTDSYLKQMEKQNPTLDFDTASVGVFEQETDISLHPLNRATSSEGATKQPHPQCLEPPPKKQRFNTLSSEELDQLSTPYIPKNMETSTKWALENFHSWLSHRNISAKSEDNKCPNTLLEDMNPAQLNKWLAVYVAETRKVNGDLYPPATLQFISLGFYVICAL